MRDRERVCWVRDGSDYIADWINDHWEFAERESGEVRWYEVPATEELQNALRASIATGGDARAGDRMRTVGGS
jgi:hypothetical protein